MAAKKKTTTTPKERKASSPPRTPEELHAAAVARLFEVVMVSGFAELRSALGARSDEAAAVETTEQFVTLLRSAQDREERVTIRHRDVNGGRTRFAFEPYMALINRGMQFGGLCNHDGQIRFLDLEGLLEVEPRKGDHFVTPDLGQGDPEAARENAIQKAGLESATAARARGAGRRATHVRAALSLGMAHSRAASAKAKTRARKKPATKS